MREYLDASVFLGVHSKEERIRVVCKNYFVKRLNDKVGMSLEQVGKCDDAIWKLSREQQDAYYPFMDHLHTIMDIQRVPYTVRDIQEAVANPQLQELEISDRLTLGMALARRTQLYSVNPRLAGRDSVCVPQAGDELTFPEELERLYQQSLEVRI